MKVKVEQKENTLYMEVIGRLDTTTAPELEASLGQYEENNIVLDFENLEYISSAGLRVLLSTLKKIKKAQGSMKILNPNESVLEVFEITGFKKIFNL